MKHSVSGGWVLVILKLIRLYRTPIKFYRRVYASEGWMQESKVTNRAGGLRAADDDLSHIEEAGMQFDPTDPGGGRFTFAQSERILTASNFSG